MTFQGFGAEALPFFKALAFHQSREWFEANRATYESAVKGPMGDLVEDVSERLAKAKIPIKGDRKSSVFRIHRDVRFSKNKDPYKTNAGVVLTRSGGKNEPGLLYFHLSPEECFFAAGFYHPEPGQLGRLRGSAARAPKAFRAMTAKLRKMGLALSEEEFAQARAARLRGHRRRRDRRRDSAEKPDLPQTRRCARPQVAGAGRRFLRLRARRAAASRLGLGRARQFALGRSDGPTARSSPCSSSRGSALFRPRPCRAGRTCRNASFHPGIVLGSLSRAGHSGRC